MFKTLSIIFAVFCVQGALSQLILGGVCPEIPPLENFNYNSIDGHWWTTHQFPQQSSIFNNTKCVQSRFTTVSNNVTVEDFGINMSTGKTETITYATQALGNGSFYFPLADIVPVGIKNTWIISIDADKYMSVFSCINLSPNLHAVIAYVFARDLDVCEKTLTKALKSFESFAIYPAAFTAIDQKDCPFFE